jgi:hypothetical protein
MDPAPTAPRRTLRTYAHSEDAEQARSLLEDHKIRAEVIVHFFTPPGSGKRLPGGCSLMVGAEDAAAATRLLLKMAPSGTAGRTEAPRPPLARSPLRRQFGPRARQRSAVPMILMALICSGAGIYWVVKEALAGKPAVSEAGEQSQENILVREDVNWDGEDDSIREYSPGGQLLSILEDRDFDGKMDFRWTWQRGQLVYRDRDIDRDGIMDERTTFDAYNAPCYVDVRWKGRGPVVRRRLYREGVLWNILEDKAADTQFDWVEEFSPGGVLIREEALPPDSPENGVPRPERLPSGTVHESSLPMVPARAVPSGP